VLSLNPAKKAVLTFRRPFGSETIQSVDSQPAPVEATPAHVNNDVLAEVEAPVTPAVSSSPAEVHC